MREGFEGFFIASCLDRHYTVVVGYTALLCPLVKYILCHSSPLLAMRRNLSWIYCVQLSQFDLKFGVKTILNYIRECVWS